MHPSLKYPEGYNDAKVTFVCRRGTAACKTIEEKWPKATIRQFDDDAIAFQEVINGNAHAILSSEPKPTFFTLQNPDKLFKPTNDNVTTTVEGFALRKGNPGGDCLLQRLDRQEQGLAEATPHVLVQEPRLGRQRAGQLMTCRGANSADSAVPRACPPAST